MPGPPRRGKGGGSAGGRGKDSKYFTTTKKGEIHELREQLRHPKPEKQRDAIKKVIAAMTVGKDVSSLFADVVNCMQTGSVELKKLVYLYLMNYAKTNPDLAILAVNTFRRDANDRNPLIRALAVRTMGCIRVEKITEYLCEPLRRSLKDEDPYVRKTAAVCVAKLYDINPELAEDQGFIDTLRGLIGDANPTVVANAVAALAEIADSCPSDVFEITTSVLQKLLAALNECTEWGQVFILDALSQYTPSDSREAEGIIERVTPRLQHANPAVVLSSVKVIMRYVDLLNNKDTVRVLARKMAPPLVTLVSSEPEIQYVALRNINLIVQKRPDVLAHEMKVFFCKYNDPIYVKMEKLEIMIKLASERNVEQVLLELREYAAEVDVEFVRRAVRAIGRCAIKLERAAERCINVLLDLIKTKVNYVVQEAIVVIKDIFRKYPNRYESVIAALCENLDTLDEPEAKASMIWIIGEYAERIDNAGELLETFLDAFEDEPPEVQLQMLTATVKLFLKRPVGTKTLMETVLSMATEHSDNPDLRDRGYVYWRLLSSNPNIAKAVVLAEKPVIKDDTGKLEPALLDDLIENIATLASIYHKPPEAFVTKTVTGIRRGSDDEAYSDYSDEDDYSDGDGGGDDDYADDGGKDSNSDSGEEQGDASYGGSGNGGGDLLDLDFGGGIDSSPSIPYATVLPASKTGGFDVGAYFDASSMSLKLKFTNVSFAGQLSKLAIQFNKNPHSYAPKKQGIDLGKQVGQGDSATFDVPVGVNPSFGKAGGDGALQIALKNIPGQVYYFKVAV